MKELSSRVAATFLFGALAMLTPLQIRAESEAVAANVAASAFLAMVEGGDAGSFYNEQLGRRWKDKTDEINSWN